MWHGLHLKFIEKLGLGFDVKCSSLKKETKLADLIGVISPSRCYGLLVILSSQGKRLPVFTVTSSVNKNS